MTEGLTSLEMLRVLMDVLHGDECYVEKIAALLPDEYQGAARIVRMQYRHYARDDVREDERCPPILDGDDYAQEIALAVLCAVETYDETCGTKFSTWVGRKIRYHLRDMYVRDFPYVGKELDKALLSVLDEAATIEHEVKQWGRVVHPEGVIAHSEAVVDFTGFVESLTLLEKKIVYLRMAEHATHEEIARDVHISRPAVSMRMATIRAKYEKFRTEEIESGRTRKVPRVVDPQPQQMRGENTRTVVSV